MSLYGIPGTTQASLENFSKTSSGSSLPPGTPPIKFLAKIYILDLKNRIVRAEDEDEVYKNLEDLSAELPESSPRFIIVHWIVKQSDGRDKMTYSLVYWLPDNANPTQRMSYASMVEGFRIAAGTNRAFQVKDTDELKNLPGRL